GELAGGVLVLVAGGDREDGALGDGAVDGGLHRGARRTVTSQREVEHVSRTGVGGQAGDGATHGPLDAGDDVGGGPAIPPQHAHRQDVHAPGHAGDAATVVGVRADGAGDVRAVPRGAAVRVVPALVGGILITPVPVSGRGGITDEVRA